MMNLNKTDFVDTMSTKCNFNDNKPLLVSGLSSTNKNLDHVIIDERIIKEMAKIIHFEFIKMKNSNNFNKKS